MEEARVFDPSVLLHKVDLQEAAKAVRDHYGFFGLLLDWQLEPLLVNFGLELTGMNFRQSEDEVLLVLKVVEDDLPYVVFLSGLSPRGCVVRLLLKLDRGTLRKYPDKYA